MSPLVGSLIADVAKDREALALKALGEALLRGMKPADAARVISELRSYLESIL